jgi:serine/threonine protein kinase/peptidoglycan hydrolase-like protein with peptidoglycan-binding domain
VLPAGTRLRAYELASVLGQGSFGITYRARDTQLDRDVAIKEYLPTSIALREAGTFVVPRSTEHAEEFMWGRERFLEEARTLAKLAHAPSIVRVFDFLEDNGTAYMVMALANGETLEQCLRREGHLSPVRVDRLLQPLLEGLEQVHAINFMHRDIKPANIIIDDTGAPTLIDFGASRLAVATRTGAMTAIFTPGYAAVEQFTSARQGPWTDIYGLSATIYQAITGTVPPSSFDRMLEDAYQLLGRLKPAGFSADLLRGIDAGMALRVSDRPQSIEGWRRVFAHSAAPSEDAVTEVLPEVRPALPAPPPWSRSFPPSSQPALSVTPASAEGTDSALASSEQFASQSHKRSQRALWLGVTVALVALSGAGAYIVTLSRPASVNTAVQNLTAEELSKALEERRKADELALEKKLQEEKAQSKASADAEAKLRADTELATTRQQRQKAEDELAKLKAEIETRRLADAGQREQAQAAERRAAEEVIRLKAEAEMATLRQAEIDAQKRAAAEAQAKKQADEALAKAQAERQQADAEVARRAEVEAAKRKADDEAIVKGEVAAKQKAEADAKQKADAELAAQRKAAEAAEVALRLATPDRQRLQVALSSLGFDTKGIDGAFGSRSREMIAAWQKAHNQLPTGFLSGSQQLTLLNEAAPAISKYEADQRKIEGDRKKAADEARAKPEAPSPEQEAARDKAQTPDDLMKPPPAATPPSMALAPSPPPGAKLTNDDKLIEEKRVPATRTSGLAGCPLNFTYTIRVFPSRVELNVGGWRRMPLDSSGKFTSGTFTISNGTKFVVNGTMSPRTFTVDNLDRVCSWKGMF